MQNRSIDGPRDLERSDVDPALINWLVPLDIVGHGASWCWASYRPRKEMSVSSSTGMPRGGDEFIVLQS